jgi:hypothetical protein
MMSFRRLFVHNWWIVVFVIMAAALYAQAIHKKNRLEQKLHEKVEALNHAKREEEERKQELLLRLQSEEDPDWIELVLKEKLGVTGEGELKVVFE